MRIVLSNTDWQPEIISAMRNDKGETLDMLYSYWYDRNPFLKGKKSEIMERFRENKQEGSRLFIDSGVFTFSKLGLTVDAKELVRFYQKYEDVIDFVFNMDCGTAEEQLNNCKLLKENGIPVIGIWHRKTMELDDFQRFLEYTDFMSIGAVANLSTKNKEIQFLYEYLYKNNLERTKMHILGTEAFNTLTQFPVYSADSTKIVTSTIIGQVAHFDRKNIEMDMIHPRRDALDTLKYYPEYEKYIEERFRHNHNLTLEEIQKNNRIVRTNRAITGINERFQFQKLLTDIWAERGVTWDD